MKTLHVLVCLLVVGVPASAGGVVLVLPEGASVVDVEAPENASVQETNSSGRVVVTVTGPVAGPVVVTGDLNGSGVVVADYLPRDPANVSGLAGAQEAVLARLSALEAAVAYHAGNASQAAENRSLARHEAVLARLLAVENATVEHAGNASEAAENRSLARHGTVLARLRALEALVTGLDPNATGRAWNGSQALEELRAEQALAMDSLRALLNGVRDGVVDVQNGTATVSGQVADLDGDVEAMGDPGRPPPGHGGVLALLSLVLLVNVAAIAWREARSWWHRYRSGEMVEEDGDGSGMSFSDPEE